MNAIFGAILREATDNNREDDSIARWYLHLAFFFHSFLFTASALICELERVNEWRTHGPFFCSFRPPHRCKK